MQEMLAAAGMPVDLERGRLLALSMQLQESLETTHSQLKASKQVYNMTLIVLFSAARLLCNRECVCEDSEAYSLQLL